MNKPMLLAATSILALCAGGAFAARLPLASFSGKIIPFHVPKGPKVLYNQNSNDEGNFSISQNFSSSPTYNDQAADDFVIPKSTSWKIAEVDVTGVYFSGSGPATSENVFFYKDMNGMPGALVKNGTFKSLNGGQGPNFSILLTNGLKLHSGRYWVSVVANVDYVDHGEWGWEVNSVLHGNQAMWQNPNDGFDRCPTWGTIEKCLGVSPDLMFDLKGASQRT